MNSVLKPLVYKADGQPRAWVSLTALEVRELTPPPGEAPIHWLLLTTLLVRNVADALQYLTWYSFRWLIERYHYVLKSGCGVEPLALPTADRLWRAFAVYSIVAWRLLWLTYQARQTPQVSCEVALETDEWQALYGFIRTDSDGAVDSAYLV